MNSLSQRSASYGEATRLLLLLSCFLVLQAQAECRVLGSCEASLDKPNRFGLLFFWMPTVLRQDGFEFVIYPNDHTPMHVHVFKSDGEVKINLLPVTVVESWNMKKSDARKAKGLAIEYQDFLIEKWREIHG